MAPTQTHTSSVALQGVLVAGVVVRALIDSGATIRVVAGVGT